MSNQEKMTTVKKTIKHKWLLSGIFVALVAAIIFTCFYGVFKRQAEQENTLEKVEYMSLIYKSSYILYRDLYNKQNGTNVSYSDLYYSPIYGKGVLSDNMIVLSEYLKEFFLESEDMFSHINAVFDYIIKDTESGEYITNLPDANIKPEEQYFYVSFHFDKNGNATLDADVRGEDTTTIRRNASEVIHTMHMQRIVEDWCGNSEYTDYLKLSMPKNCTVTFGMKADDYASNFQYQASYWQTDAVRIYLFMLLAVCLLGMFVPYSLKGKPWKELRLCRPLVEIVVFVGICVCSLGYSILDLLKWVLSGKGVAGFQVILPGTLAVIGVYFVNIAILFVLFFVAWFVGICVSEVGELGLKEYIKKRLFCYRIFPYTKEKIRNVYYAACHLDITKDAGKLIFKIVLINAAIVFLISCFWVGGFAIAVVYSVVLYFVLRKYISDLQKKYSILLEAVNEIAEGKLNVEITEDLGVFEPFKPQMIRIQNGFQKAVEEEVKSQRMKTELLTNVSHDLKTPLTAIITYINLLKEENITEEQRKEYIDTLERKSMRLKVLIEDVVEVSKASSKNMTVNLMDVDLCNLLKQVSFEMSDKMAVSKLDLRLNLPEDKVIVTLDSQKAYRIYENLFGNITKYALTGTRVYVDLVQNQDEVSVIMRNITAEEISVNVEDLTERFVRGDVSRNTEGSGLGLAIAKSLTELQGGRLEIKLDGDLFKVTTIWKLPSEIEKITI